MAYICYNCGKVSVAGVSQRHKRGVAGKRWSKRTTATKRDFRPNLQKTSIMINGKKTAVLLCTKCIKKLKRIKTYSANSALG